MAKWRESAESGCSFVHVEYDTGERISAYANNELPFITSGFDRIGIK